MNAITANEVGIRLSPSVGLALGTGAFGLKDRSLARLADASDRRDNHRYLGEENLGNLCLAGDNAGRQNLFAIGRSVGCLHIRSLLDRGLVANYSVAFLRKRCRVEKSKTAPKKGNNTHAVLGSGTVVIGGAPFPPLPPLSSLSDFSPLSPLSPLPQSMSLPCVSAGRMRLAVTMMKILRSWRDVLIIIGRRLKEVYSSRYLASDISRFQKP